MMQGREEGTQPAEVTDSDEQCERVADLLNEIGWRSHCDANWSGLHAALPRLAAILALRPVSTFCEYCGGNDEDPVDHCMDCTRPAAVPMTDDQRRLAFLASRAGHGHTAFMLGISASESHHGITAQAKKEAP